MSHCCWQILGVNTIKLTQRGMQVLHLGLGNPLVHVLHVLGDGLLPLSGYPLMFMAFGPFFRMLNGLLGRGSDVFIFPLTANQADSPSVVR